MRLEEMLWICDELGGDSVDSRRVYVVGSTMSPRVAIWDLLVQAALKGVPALVTC